MPVLVEKKTPTCKEKVALRTTFPVRREGGGNVLGNPASPTPVLRARIAPLRWPLQKWRRKSHLTPSLLAYDPGERENQTLSPRTKGEEMANDERSVKWPSATRTSV